MITIKNTIGAIFQLTVRKLVDNSVVKQTPKFPNLVLDAGLAQMAKGSWGGTIYVGTGNSEPNVQQTQLDTMIAQTSSTTSSNDTTNTTVKPYYTAITNTYRFGAGAAKGNLTEVGFGWRGGKCWNRSLIKDVHGRPTTLTILDDEFLDVTIEIRVYSQERVSGSFSFKDKLGAVISTHNYTGYCTVRQAQNSFNAWDVNNLSLYTNSEITETPTSGLAGKRLGSTGSESNALVSTGQTTCVIPCVFGLSQGNGSCDGLDLILNGVLSIGGTHGYKFKLDKPIVKTSEMEITYNVTLSWGRYTEE